MTLREDLADWCDWDAAAGAYGRALGVFDGANRRQISRVLLSDNPLGDGLHDGLIALVEAGVVERREEPEEQFRWVFTSVTDILGDVDPHSVVALPRLPDQAPLDEGEPAAEPGGRRWWQRR